MRSRERMASALRGLSTDRPPLAYQFLGGTRHVLGRMGVRMRAVYQDAGRIAEAQVVAAEMFGDDAGMVPWGCLTVEAEAFGCRLESHTPLSSNSHSRFSLRHECPVGMLARQELVKRILDRRSR